MTNSNVFFSKDIYEDITDEELLKRIKMNDKTALNYLINRYKDVVSMKVSKYYLNGAEKEDIEQEGFIGLYKAIRDFDFQKQNSFKTFANLCIERQIITAVKGSNRQKHLPLNSYLSLNTSNYENADGEEEGQLIEVLDANPIEDPLDTVTKNEYYKTIEKTISESLSDFEKQVLSKFIEGQSYIQIAEELNSPVKSIDNAIQRIRKKTIKNLGNEMIS